VDASSSPPQIERHTSGPTLVYPHLGPQELASGRVLDGSDRLWTVQVGATQVQVARAHAEWSGSGPFLPIPRFARKYLVTFGSGGALFNRVMDAGQPLVISASTVRVRGIISILSDEVLYPGVDGPSVGDKLPAAARAWPFSSTMTASLILGAAPEDAPRWTRNDVSEALPGPFLLEALGEFDDFSPCRLQQLYIHNQRTDQRYARIYDYSWTEAAVGGDDRYWPAGGKLPSASAVPPRPWLVLPLAPNAITGVDLSESRGRVFHRGVFVVGSTSATADVDPRPLSLYGAIYSTAFDDPEPAAVGLRWP
jgi:hypothetical protein